MNYSKDKTGLTYVVEFFKNLLFDKVAISSQFPFIIGFNYLQR